MGKKYNEGDDLIESGNWNVAKIYAHLKIMKPLAEIDDYKKIIEFGTSEMVDEFVVDEQKKTEAKVMALKRFHKNLQMLVSNSKFAVKKKDKPMMEEYATALKKLKEVLPLISRRVTLQSRGGQTFQERINPDTFTKVLNILESISDSVLEPLNRADLIFVSIDEFDPHEWKQRAMDELINQG